MSGAVAVLVSAPGAGLGHLTRAVAICSRLADLGIGARVVSDSPFCGWMADLTGCTVDRLPPHEWERSLAGYVAHHRPRLVAVDSYPYGLRGEWREAPRGTRLVCLARRLRLDAYRRSLPDPPPERLPFAHAVLLEPPDDEMAGLLDGVTLFRLPGRVRLAPPAGLRPPPALEELAGRGGLALVVHSGPPAEVDALLALAKEHVGADAAIAVITPWATGPGRQGGFAFFPASILFDRAAVVFGGAGYNLVAEMAPHPGRYRGAAFPRKFDDQAWRLAAPGGAEDGAPAAAAALAGLL